MKKLSLMRATAPGLLLLALVRLGAAQTLPRSPKSVSTPLNEDTTQVNLNLTLPPDSLVAVPLAPVDSVKLAWLQTPPEVRDLVCDRIGCFETDVPHAFNNSVMAYVNFFTQRNRGYTQRVLERENLYFPLFEKYLAKYNLPIDLKYLAVVESALIPTAKSRVGATGLWQFMGPTAGDLHLQRDEWVDERMSPEKSTEAACKHLRYLYGVFHDWELVLAAYNWGAGNVQRVMRHSGKKNFWDLYPYMPAETRNYVPTFTAIMYAMKYAQAHQLHAPDLHYQYAEALDTLTLRGRAFDLRRLSQAVSLPDSMALLRYNPEIRRAYLPDGYRSYVIQVPVSVRTQLALVDRATLLAYCRPVTDLPTPLTPLSARLQGGATYTAVVTAQKAPPPEQPASALRTRRKIHTVQRGQTVAELAEWYGVSQSQLRRWNNLGRSQALKSRQKLVVFVPQPADDASVPTAVAVRPTTAPAEATPTLRTPAELGIKVAKVPVAAAASAPTPAPPTPPTHRAEPPSAPEPVAVAAITRRAESPTQKSQPAAKPAAPVIVAAVVEAPAAADDTLPAAAYTVRRGDYLTKLAREHEVTVAQLIAWNHLESDQVVPGQKLVFRAVEEAEPPTVAAAVRTQRQPVSPAATPAAPARALPPKMHLVQPGDTLYNISRRYQGVTVEQLRRLNHLKSDAVQPGQKLLVAG